MRISIQRLTSEDSELLREAMNLFATAFDDRETYNGAPPDNLYRRKLLARESFVTLVALKDDNLVGAVTAYILPKPEQARSEMYVYDLAVAAEHRRGGIATRLMTSLKPIARAEGCHVIFVQADHGDVPAIRLYESLGKLEEVLHFDVNVT